MFLKKCLAKRMSTMDAAKGYRTRGHTRVNDNNKKAVEILKDCIEQISREDRTLPVVKYKT